MATKSRRIQLSINASLFPFLTTPKFFMRAIPNYQPNGKNLLVLTSQMIKENGTSPLSQFNGANSWTIVEDFLKAVLGDRYSSDHPIHDNLFSVVYDQNQLKFFGSPVICKHDGKIQLLFGVSNKDLGLEFSTFPLVVGEKGITIEGSDIPYIEPSVIEVPDFSSNDRSARKRINTLLFGTPKWGFNSNIKLRDGVDELEFKDVWNSKDMTAILNIFRGLYGYSTPFSYTFSKLFQLGMFPEQGVVLKIVGGKVIKSKDSKMGDSVIFTLDTDGLPPVNVVCKDASTKQFFDAPINEVTSLLCGNKHGVATEFLNGTLEEPTPEKPWLLHIERQGQATNTVPRHSTYDQTFVPGYVNQCLDAQKDPNKLLKSSEPSQLFGEDDNPNYNGVDRATTYDDNPF